MPEVEGNEALKGLALMVDPGPHRDVFLDLEAQASRPYTQFITPDPSQASALQRFLYDQGGAEFAPPFGRLVLQGDIPVGMVACLTAEQVHKCRLRAALALTRSGWLQQDPDLQSRIRCASHALWPLEGGDFYLSRIAVVPHARRQGIGHRLLDYVELEARHHGSRRLALEVDARQAGLLRFYQQHHLEEYDRHVVHAPLTGYVLDYVLMAKLL